MGEERGGGGRTVGVVYADHVPPEGVSWRRDGHERYVGTVSGGGVSVRVSFLRSDLEEVVLFPPSSLAGEVCG